MEKLLFIASIQYGEPPTGGGAQAKNQLLLAHLQKYYDVRFFDTWNKSSALCLLSALVYVILYKFHIYTSYEKNLLLLLKHHSL